MTHRFTALIIAAFAALAFAVVPVNAWGPERDSYTVDDPADKITFNSITDNPALGSEYDFVRIGEVQEDGSVHYSDEVNLAPDKEYQVYIYYHNNAAENLRMVAFYTRIAAQFQTMVMAEEKGKVSAILSSIDAEPPEVWDEAWMINSGDETIVLRYVPASAKIYNNSPELSGTVLSDELLFSSDGIYVGVNELNGELPGGPQYAGHIVYRLRAELANAAPDASADNPVETLVPNGQTQSNEGEQNLSSQNSGFRMPAWIILVLAIVVVAAGGWILARHKRSER